MARGDSPCPPFLRGGATRRVLSPRHARSGFSLIELIISGLLLSVLFVSTAPTLGWIARNRREVERRQLALAVAENTLERLSALPWGELTAERASEAALPESAARQLPAGELRATVTADADDPAAKRLSVEIHWQDRPETISGPVRLTTWVYQAGEEAR